MKSARPAGFSVIAVAMVVLVVGCGSSADAPSPTPKCVHASDCNSTLLCVQGYCVAACVTSKDCPSSERCIRADEGMTCQALERARCAYNSECTRPLICSGDQQCRHQCKTDVDCPMTQRCTAVSKLCADPVLDGTYDSVTNEFKGATAAFGEGRTAGTVTDGGPGDAPADVPTISDDGGVGGGGGGGGTGAGGAGGAARPCPTPQTTFADVFQGSANANFTSGVGVRSGNQIFIFSGYSGPIPTTVDAGAAPDAAIANGNFIFQQTFDLATGTTSGPAAQLFQIDDGLLPNNIVWVQDVAVAPTGDIVLLHGHGPPGDNTPTQLFASFFSVGAAQDAGSATLRLERTVQIESVRWTSAHAIWSAASQVFVLSWRYAGPSGVRSRVRRFQFDGRAAGGDTNDVPTVNGTQLTGTFDDGHAGTSRSLVGVAYASTTTGPLNAFLTLLGADGAQVGTSVQLSSVRFFNGDEWLTVAGTTMGFAAFFYEAGMVYEVFVPTSDKDGVMVADAGAGADASDAGTAKFAGFSFASTATTAHAISDDPGGLGGVGLVLRETNGATFVYVTADGSQHMATGVISSSSGGTVAIANYHGSFSVSLYDTAKHATQVAASGCEK